MIDLRQGDCLEVMRTLPDESVHACVTDPPYGLAFMGKKWDYDVPTEDVWREVLRVLKPGGFLLSFSGARTYHRMVVRIEDAGFEIRDMIQWLYGSGFPKSHDVSKAIDREAGAEREVVGQSEHAANRTKLSPPIGTFVRNQDDRFITAPATDAAKQWEGWGTALKPANEPICVARKPLIGTVAQNVLAHGCGGLNIDGCRVGGGGQAKWSTPRGGIWSTDSCAKAELEENSLGRWPANVVHDGSDEVLALFPNANGSKPGSFQRVKTSKGLPGGGYGQERADMRDKTELAKPGYEDAGSAARFFYSAKADRAEREKGVEGERLPGGSNAKGYTADVARGLDRNRPTRNHHPTVKPVDLMRWLVRLMCPPGGVCLDPFMGSGTTGVACRLEGFGFIGIDLNAEYVELARQRINAETPSLFAGGGL